MKKNLQAIVAVLMFFGFALSTSAALLTPNSGGLLTPIANWITRGGTLGTALIPAIQGDTIGDAANPWSSITATFLNVASSTRNLDMGGFQITNAGRITSTSLSATSTTATSTITNALSIGSATSSPNAIFNIAGASSTIPLVLISTSTPAFATTTVMVIDATGKVGIGTANPTVPLQVTTTDANATTSVELGKVSQNKGTCLVMYDAVGTAQYLSVQGGVLKVSSTSCK